MAGQACKWCRCCALLIAACRNIQVQDAAVIEGSTCRGSQNIDATKVDRRYAHGNKWRRREQEVTSEELNEASNHGGEQQEETEARHPQIPDGRVHHHGGTLQRGLELDLVSKDRVHGTPESLHSRQNVS